MPTPSGGIRCATRTTAPRSAQRGGRHNRESAAVGRRLRRFLRCRTAAEVFGAEELPALKPVPEDVFDIPVWAHPKVAPDRHVQIAKALDSVPGNLVGRRIDARADAHSVKLYWRGELIKVHPGDGAGAPAHRSG